MAQKPRLAKQIPDKEFDRVSQEVLEKDRELLEMLAKV